jgi:hypothetical protein
MKKGELALNVQGLVTGVFYITPVDKARERAIAASSAMKKVV